MKQRSILLTCQRFTISNNNRFSAKPYKNSESLSFFQQFKGCGLAHQVQSYASISWAAYFLVFFLAFMCCRVFVLLHVHRHTLLINNAMYHLSDRRFLFYEHDWFAVAADSCSTFTYTHIAAEKDAVIARQNASIPILFIIASILTTTPCFLNSIDI